MRNLIVFCGIPASGKTTFSKEIEITCNMKRISMDESRYIRHSDMIEPIKNYLLLNNSVVVDSVYTQRRQREQLLKSVEDIPCKKVLIYMNIPLDECIIRNRKRENSLPVLMLESMNMTFETPSLSEGWDEIIYYNEDTPIK